MRGLNTLADDEIKQRRVQEQVSKEQGKKEGVAGLERIRKLYEYQVYESNISPADFFKGQQKDPVAFSVGLNHMQIFERIYENKQKIFGPCYEEQSLKTTLEEYLANNPPPEGLDCLAVIRKAKHGALLKAVCKIFLVRDPRDNKRYAVRFQGPTSAGKTKFIKLIQEIFVCQKADFVRGHLVVQAKAGAKKKFRT